MTNEEFMYLGNALTTHEYTFAKTMPRHPHWYTIRYEWDDDSQFVNAVKLIRRHGYDRRFYSKHYTSFDLNEHYYWTMGEPIDKDGKPWTYIINRAVRRFNSDYDSIGQEYDGLFKDDFALAENSDVMEAIGYSKGESILDIGCGTGLFLEYNDCDDYLGIDPSEGMLARLSSKFPSAETVRTEFESFYTPRRFDKVISTFGSCSYIDPKTISRVRDFTKPDGSMLLMFYKDGYHPVTYAKTGVEFGHHRVSEYLEELGDVKVAEYHNFVIVTN